MDRNSVNVINRCTELKQFWSPRDAAMKRWYRMVEMIDELKTEKLESFVGNDPRALYNLVLHLLDTFPAGCHQSQLPPPPVGSEEY